ncbi:hypothetical protein DOTSEDRAFT_170804 [Dothistroma septosporum NZE10]|uniref:Uncharacterized protein n=1 Tax=Dothistroma septosporum (strain NZE10 / CBS 128990) TaxID=675120 RepID=N1PSM1_DOTSN|nr:hypothetical protein DOTSEDRAFT_170804 [Dothistroma septosporum NZE10]
MSHSAGITRAAKTAAILFPASCRADHGRMLWPCPDTSNLSAGLLTLRTTPVLDSHGTMEKSSLCLCFPCILYYLDGYIYPRAEHQFYPVLLRKGFTRDEQLAIAEEWYWVAFERETAVKDYMNGYVTFTDGCTWRPPPLLQPSYASTPGASSSSSRSTTGS